MIEEFSDLITLITGLTSSSDPVLFAMCGILVFGIIFGGFISVFKNLFSWWR